MGEIVEFQAIGLKAEKHVLEPCDQPAQASVGGEILNERFALNQTSESLLQRLLRQEQKPVLGEKICGAGVRDVGEQRLLLGERLRQFDGSRSSQLGRRRRDDHVNDSETVKRAFKCDVAFAPVEFVRKHSADV